MRRFLPLFVYVMIGAVAALALGGCQKDACGRTVLFPGPFDWLQAASGSCPVDPPAGEDDAPDPAPEALDPAQACALEPSDGACVQCAKTSCCEVFLDCDAEGCAPHDPAETMCLAAHCKGACP